MNQTATLPAELLLHIRKEIDIDAPLAIAFEALLEQLGPASEMAPGKPMPMKIEPWPGGRWYRDLGNNTGHFWGHVQVIKPPKLLEITGPIAMSYAAINHIQYRLTEKGAGTHLALVHRAMGEIPREHRDGMPEGWEYILEKVRERAEGRGVLKR
ncbi:MAG: SRPBCC domain-containing protein [Planctomycetes bacterium]|nr:SRPBCC domain-containing protein [Planctomycetota bacterium]